MIDADNELANPRFNPIASDDDICLCHGPIQERQKQPPIAFRCYIVQSFTKLGNPSRNQLDHLIQEPGSVHTILAEAVGDGERGLLMPIGVLVVSVEIVKPHLLLGGPDVACADCFKGLIDAVVAAFHRLHSVGAERDTRPDLPELWCLLVKCYWYVPIMQSDC